MKRLTLCCMGMALGCVSAALAADFRVERGALEQGGYLLGKVPVGSVVRVDGERLPVTPEGDFVVGFDRDHGRVAKVEVCAPSAPCDVEELTVKAVAFKTQNVRGAPPETVNPNPAEEKVIAADNVAIKAARAKALASKWEAFAKPWVWPAQGELSGVFGSRRLYDGQEKSWHRGTDIAAPTGTPVVAPAGGVVRLARKTFLTGNLLLLDHGYGVTSLYAHLSRMNVKVGDRVQQGEEIGRVGTTGRSSGPHLHWGIYWRRVPINATLWVEGRPRPLEDKQNRAQKGGG